MARLHHVLLFVLMGFVMLGAMTQARPVDDVEAKVMMNLTAASDTVGCSTGCNNGCSIQCSQYSSFPVCDCSGCRCIWCNSCGFNQRCACSGSSCQCVFN
eukprot:Colp12_sorted_trinity150504_noHs@5720